MSRIVCLAVGIAVGVALAAGPPRESSRSSKAKLAAAQEPAPRLTPTLIQTAEEAQALRDRRVRGWVRGKGWGWVWGKDDQLGALNAMNEQSRLAALRLARSGKVYDLGVPYDRNSYKWPGHSPGEVLSFRTPEGVKRQQDFEPAVADFNRVASAWHSCALFISDNVGTQIDGLGHITAGADNHWYNGFTEAKWGGNFGIRRCSAAGIPPIINRAVMLDVAAARGLKVLPPHYEISPNDVESALKRQKVDIQPGDIVLLRTGTLQYWGENGKSNSDLVDADTAGITLATARYLVEQKGALAIGSDTSGLEVAPAPQGSNSFVPVHNYLLVEQGVHILEFHDLEALSAERVYEFCYVGTTNKILGAAAGFALRPLALR